MRHRFFDQRRDHNLTLAIVDDFHQKNSGEPCGQLKRGWNLCLLAGEIHPVSRIDILHLTIMLETPVRHRRMLLRGNGLPAICYLIDALGHAQRLCLKPCGGQVATICKQTIVVPEGFLRKRFCGEPTGGQEQDSSNQRHGPNHKPCPPLSVPVDAPMIGARMAN